MSSIVDNNSLENIYIIMNKPCGYVCSAVSDSHKTVYELLSPELQALVQGAKRGHRLHTVGRLDCNTSGLLLFTTDGNFSHTITFNTDSENCISKTYRVKLLHPVSTEEQNEYILRAAEGLILPPEKKFGEQKSSPAELRFISSVTSQTDETLCEITVHEGKFHEVRRIFRALGNEVAALERISIGSLCLPENLLSGEWRFMTDSEKSECCAELFCK